VENIHRLVNDPNLQNPRNCERKIFGLTINTLTAYVTAIRPSQGLPSSLLVRERPPRQAGPAAPAAVHPIPGESFPGFGTTCCLRWRGDLVQERHGDLLPVRLGHQLADTNVVDSKWRLLISSTALYSLGLQRHFRLLTSWAKRYWLSGEEGGAYLSVQRDIFRPPSPNYPHLIRNINNILTVLRPQILVLTKFRSICLLVECTPYILLSLCQYLYFTLTLMYMPETLDQKSHTVCF